MGRWKTTVAVLTVGLLLASSVSVTLAQQGGGGGRGGRSRWDPAQRRQQQMDRIQEALQADAESWAVLQPRIEKLMAASQETQSRMGRFMGRLRRRSGGEAGTAEGETPLSPVAAATQALQTVLENEAATADEIKAALTTLREAREKAEQELDKAQAAVLELLTQRQEAQLVLMGMLD